MSLFNRSIDIKLSSTDIEAILCALPIVADFPADSEAQQLINSALCVSVSEKLHSRRTDLSPNEWRIISIAVYCGREFTAGRLPDLQPPENIARQLRSHFFAYNRLCDLLSPYLDM